jgi:peptide-methionine (S)-S-oxide reductase
MIPVTLVVGVALFAALGVRPTADRAREGAKKMTNVDDGASGNPPAGCAWATFANGCFWCTEAVFQRLKGVESVAPGYMGGHVANPTYEAVCTGGTGHAECVRIAFDPKTISYTELLEVFFRTHDPTTKNRQGPDVGTQYRSAIFFHDDAQRTAAEQAVKKLDEAGVFPAPIVTEIAPAETFYAAENYHRNYYRNHPGNSYCQVMIGPKLEKLKKAFAGLLRQKE